MAVLTRGTDLRMSGESEASAEGGDAKLDLLVDVEEVEMLAKLGRKVIAAGQEIRERSIAEQGLGLGQPDRVVPQCHPVVVVVLIS